MKTLLQYIEKNWGKPQYCISCKSNTSLSICGACFEHVYCGRECQTKHWKLGHQYECISGRTKITGEEEEKEEYQDKKQEISLNDLSRDIWQHISFFLSGDDLKNLSMIDKIIQQRIRQQFFRRFRWIITSDMFDNPRFSEIKNAIQAVTISNRSDLDRLIELGAPLKDVKLSRDFNEAITLPQGLTHFTMGYNFNQPITLPQGLTHFEMGVLFNQHITLPQSLTHLIMGHEHDFNQPITLPESLTHFTMGYWFNHPITLPQGLTHFEMGEHFNQPIVLPQSLTHFYMGYRFNQPITTFPQGLVYLSYHANYPFPENIPRNIPRIVILN
jgi:hypothetical protein